MLVYLVDLDNVEDVMDMYWKERNWNFILRKLKKKDEGQYNKKKTIILINQQNFSFKKCDY